MKQIRTLLVDDSLEFLASANDFLSHDAGMLVVGQAQSGDEGLRLVDELTPDLVMMDLEMPNMGGLAATRLIKARPTPPKVVIVTLHDNPEYWFTASEAQADGLIHKGSFAAAAPGLIASLFPSSEGIVAPIAANTADQQSESVLQEVNERLREAVSAGNVGLWDWDLRTNRVRFSTEWKRQIGYADHEISDSFEEWRSRVHPGDLQQALQTVQATLSSDTAHYESEFRFRHKDGSYRHILARGTKFLDAAGLPSRLLGSHVDFTERWQLQAQFLQAQKMETVGRLAGGIAHDFNNLLTVINGTADFALADLGDADRLRTEIEDIRRAGDRAAALTRQLLAFSRQQIMKPEVLHLGALVANMRSMLDRLIGEDITLGVVVSDDAGHVRADPGQIEQVIMNLVVNARDAMPRDGTMTIEVRNVDHGLVDAIEQAPEAPGPYVMLAVSDTGHGMNEATRARIFEPFFTTKGLGKGTGLGLSTVYGIVKQSGGTITVYGEPGIGTTFKIYLPLVAAAAQAPHVAPAAAPTTGTETILVVEDEAALRHLVGRMLRSAGYTVLEAGSGMAARDALSRHEGTVHLLVADVVLPDITGRELAAQLSEIDRRMAVLVMSGYTDDAILRHGVIDAEAHFLRKPFTKPELLGRVREVLDAPRVGAPDPAPGN